MLHLTSRKVLHLTSSKARGISVFSACWPGKVHIASSMMKQPNRKALGRYPATLSMTVAERISAYNGMFAAFGEYGGGYMGRRRLARRLGLSDRACCAWQRAGSVPAERVVAVERATGVTCGELRPDVYGPEWSCMKSYSDVLGVIPRDCHPSVNPVLAMSRAADVATIRCELARRRLVRRRLADHAPLWQSRHQ